MLHRIFIIIFTLFSPFLYASNNNPPALQLATIYHEDINIQEYWISEKLDGVRAYWDGKQLISKQGNIYHAPQWFVKDFPDIPLDGELWIDRQQFEKVSSITRKHNATAEEWQKVSFMIFDLPSSLANFSTRIEQMQQLVSSSHSPYLKMVIQEKVADNSQLQSLLEEVLTLGGEGLMLHHQHAYYQAKRSKDLMKLKSYQDAEAIVKEHRPGKGRNTGRLGALVVETTEGIQFKIGTGFSDQERINPPPIGAIITYKYVGKTKNDVPRFASFIRIRKIY
jgi:DNA ligase-1